MTVFLIISLLLTASFAVFTALSGRLSGKTAFAVNGILTVLGAIGIPVFAMLFRSSNTSVDADWASDNFAFFMKISLIAAGVLLFLTVVPTLVAAAGINTSGYAAFLRKAFPVFSSAALLMLALLAYPFVRHITSNIGIFICLEGIAEAMLMRLPYTITDIKKYRSEKAPAGK